MILLCILYSFVVVSLGTICIENSLPSLLSSPHDFNTYFPELNGSSSVLSFFLELNLHFLKRNTVYPWSDLGEGFHSMIP